MTQKFLTFSPCSATSTQNKQNWLNFFCLACPFVASSCKLNFTHTVAHISTLTHTLTD